MRSKQRKSAKTRRAERRNEYAEKKETVDQGHEVTATEAHQMPSEPSSSRTSTTDGSRGSMNPLQLQACQGSLHQGILELETSKMATLDLMTGMVSHPDYFSLEQELAGQNIPLSIGNTMMLEDMEITLDSDFEDLTTKPCKPVQITDPNLVNTILRNQSDSCVASACASFIEHMNDYMCAETALKEQKLDAVNIEVTSWVEKKRLKEIGFHDSSLDTDTQRSMVAKNGTPQIAPSVNQLSPGILSNNVVSLLHGTSNKRIYRCSRCPFTHNELKEVAAHQAVFHLPEKKSNSKPPPDSLALNISKVQCPHCQQKHINGRYSCRNCSFETMCPMELEQHMWSIHKSMHIYHCPCCSFISQTYMLIENHLVQDHAISRKDNAGSAAQNDQASTSTSGMNDSAVTGGKDASVLPAGAGENTQEGASPRVDSIGKATGPPVLPAYNCAPCKFNTAFESDFKIHVSKYHNPYSCMPYMCLLCGKEAFNKRGLELHSKLRHKSEPQSFALNSNSLKVMKEVTERKSKDYLRIGYTNDRTTSVQWWCLVCGSGPQPYVYHLTPHIASHLCYTPYQCSACGMKFKLQLLANNHIKESKTCANTHNVGVRINTYLKKLQMADVEILRKDVPLYNGYSNRSNPSNDAQLPFLCQICHYACRCASALLQHMHLHLQIKPHRCPVESCNSSHATKQACMSHIKKFHGVDKNILIKTIVSDYNMLKLQKEDAQKLVLENSIHLPQSLLQAKMFAQLDACKVCNFGPCGKAGLATHSAFHFFKTPYRCVKCGKKFKQEIVASIHALEVHHSHSTDIIEKDAEAAAEQQQWVATHLLACKSVSPEYSLKSVNKDDETEAATAAKDSVPPASPFVYPYKDPGENVVVSPKAKNPAPIVPSPSSAGGTSNHKKLYRCRKCCLYSTNYSNSRNHVLMHLPHKPYECTICGERYQSTMFCGKHLHSHGPEITMKKHMKVVNDILREQSKAAADLIEELPIEEGTDVAKLLASNQKLKGKKPSDSMVSVPDLPSPGSSGKAKPATATGHRDYVCYCKHENATRKGARQHFLMKHAMIPPYSCKHCSFESNLHQLVIEHAGKEHPDLQGSTDVVNTDAAKERLLKKSLDRYLAQSFKPSQRRGELLNSSTTAVPEHYRAICITSSGRSCTYKCTKCSYTARSIDAFKKHVQEHLEIEQYRCAHCDYSNDKHIYRHIRFIHGSKEEYDDVVETKAYIMLVTQMEDLAREVLLLDEMCHADDGGDIGPEAFPSTPEYTCICMHCKETFSSLVNARKHHQAMHTAKQLMIDVDLSFKAALDQNKPEEDDKLDKSDDTPNTSIVKTEADTKVNKLEPVSKKVKQEPRAQKAGRIDVASTSKTTPEPSTSTAKPVGRSPSTAKSKPSVSTPLRPSKGKGAVAVTKRESRASAAAKSPPVVKSSPAAASRTRSPPKGKPAQRRVEPESTDRLICHLCKTSLVNMHSLRRHLIMAHTGLRPYRCSKCKFTSHEKYEVKRHGVRKHKGKDTLVENAKDAKAALETMRNFIEDWKASHTGLLQSITGDEPTGQDDVKLSMRPVVQLEDISKNPDFAKYFSKK